MATQHQLHLLPRLWQKVQIQPEWENALEAVLRERLNSIEFEQLDLIQKLIKDLPSGKWVIFGKTQPWFPSIKRLTMDHTGYKKLISYITVNQSEILAVLEDWLCQIYVIEDIDEGLIKRSTLNSGEMLVTRQGHLITSASLTFYAPDSELHGVLSRQQE